MNTISACLIVIAFSYLVGCSNMALYLSKYKHVDLKNNGSGNPGASNAMILMGWKAGIIVGLHDILKAVLAVYLAKHYFPDIELIGCIAGVAAVMGHMFPFYMRFKGGKGFASYFGMTLALDWKLALCIAIAVIVVTLVTDYIVVGTVTTVVGVPAYMFFSRGWTIAVVLLIATVVILYKHRENFVRIYKGTEIGLRKANRGDYRQ